MEESSDESPERGRAPVLPAFGAAPPPPAAGGSLFPVHSAAASHASTPPTAAVPAPPGESWLSLGSFNRAIMQPGGVNGSAGSKTPTEPEQARGGKNRASAFFYTGSTSEDDSSGSEGGRRGRRGDVSRKRKRRKKDKKDKKDKKKRRRREEQDLQGHEAAAVAAEARRATVKGWAGQEKVAREAHYFDTRADHDNLAFGCLYRLDVAAYRRLPSDGGAPVAPPQGPERFGVEVEPPPSTSGKEFLRCFASTRLRRERDRTLRRWRIRLGDSERAAALVAPLPDYIPLLVPRAAEAGGTGGKKGRVQIVDGMPTMVGGDSGESGSEGEKDEGESFEDFLMRRSKDYNIATRERPYDLKLWLEFAAFQDEYLRLSRKRTQVVSTVEKKIAIYERALDHHPGSDELLMSLLEASRQVLDRDAVAARWDAVLARHRGSVRLWREWLRLQRATFSAFSISSVRRCHSRALSALKAESSRRRAEGAPPEVVAQAEAGVLEVFLESCRLELQSGHTEMCVARVQAAVEWASFPPSLALSRGERLRLFEAFWRSDAARVGEEGARGWGAWVDGGGRIGGGGGGGRGSPPGGDGDGDPAPAPEEAGGWGGWTQLEAPTDDRPVAEGGEGEGGEGEEGEGEEGEQGVAAGETEEELMERLGLSLDEKLGEGELTPPLLRRWAEIEADRGRATWRPLRESAAEDEDADLEAVVEFDDVRECLLELGSPGLRAELVARCLEMLGIPLEAAASGLWAPDPAAPRVALLHASSAPLSAAEDDAMVAPAGTVASILAPLGTARGGAGGREAPAWLRLDPPAGGPGAAARGWRGLGDAQAAFVARAAVMAAGSEAGAPGAGEQAAMYGAAVAAQGDPAVARGMAKQLLAEHRDLLPLFGQYAQVEARAGKTSAARKVFATALASAPSLPPARAADATALALAWAQLELEAGGEGGRARALHILAAAAGPPPFEPPPAPVKGGGAAPWPGEAAVAAGRKGLQERLGAALGSAAGRLNPHGVHVAVSFATLELLAGRRAAARSVYEQVLQAAPRADQAGDACYESLHACYCAALHDMSGPAASTTPAGPAVEPGVSPGAARAAMVDSLALFPRSAPLLRVLAAHDARASSLTRTRRHLDRAAEAAPSPVVALLAMRVEAAGEGGGNPHRIRAVVERALAEKAATRTSVMLWRAFLRFELAQGRTDAARRVFFRAIHACPWAKELWLDGLRSLGSELSPREAGELIDIMREKELRVRTDVLEVLLEKAEEEDDADMRRERAATPPRA